MIYADTSALAKLLVEEDESAALGAWLAAHDEPVATNVVGTVELRRLADRAQVGPDAVAALLVRLDKVPLTPSTIALAGEIRPPAVRTLDALHVASAAELPDLTALLSYDERVLDAAAGYGLPVASPA